MALFLIAAVCLAALVLQGILGGLRGAGGLLDHL